MGLYLLFGLLIYCLACFREGVRTRYTPQDVARGQGPVAQQSPLVPFEPVPAHPKRRSWQTAQNGLPTSSAGTRRDGTDQPTQQQLGHLS